MAVPVRSGITWVSPTPCLLFFALPHCIYSVVKDSRSGKLAVLSLVYKVQLWVSIPAECMCTKSCSPHELVVIPHLHYGK